MKQTESLVHRLIKGLMTLLSMFIFSVSLASGDITAPVSDASTPYSYADPNSTTPSYNNVGRPVDAEAHALTVNNQLLGLQGPVQVSGTYSNNYGYGVQAELSHMLGFDDAISLLGAYASKENRIDITWAHAWTEKQRTKLSVERLEEKMNFDYDSGSASAWVPQYAYGAGYQYIFNKNWLKNVEFSGYYADAQSQDLDTVVFTGSNGHLYDNYRHVAGATSVGSAATLNVSPWTTGLVGLGLNYDNVNYNTKYDDTDADNASGLGFTLSLEQLLSKHVKINLEGSQREVYDNYLAGISFLIPSNIEVGLSGERTIGENGSANDTRFNVNLAYFFDDKNRYVNGYSLGNTSESDLAQWASQSAAHMDEVLAAADQKTVLIQAPQSVRPQSFALSTESEIPVLSLTAGEVNHISIADYIEKSNLTESQKQATPTIQGGPKDVAFTYDHETQSLVTTAEVPASEAETETQPLLVIFPSNTHELALSDTTSTNQLKFKVTVAAAASLAPTLNPDFINNHEPTLNQGQTWVFNYENIAQPAGPADAVTMFLNDNTSYKKLLLTSVTPNENIGTHNCYTVAHDDVAQTLTVTAIGSSVCPDSGSIAVVVNNTLGNSPTQTITFSQQTVNSPIVNNVGNALSATVEGNAYDYVYSTSPMLAGPSGSNESFKTAAVTVIDAGNNNADVSSGFSLVLNADNTAITHLQASAATVATLKGPLNVTYTVTNTDDQSKSSTTADTIATDAIAINDATMTEATVGTTYHYDFAQSAGLVVGSTGLSTTNSTVVMTINGTTVNSDQLGLSPVISSSNIVVSGIPNVGYAGETVTFSLSLQTPDGQFTKTNTSTLTIAANDTTAPIVNNVGNALSPTVEGNAYDYVYPTSPMLAGPSGSNESFKTAAVTVIDVGNNNADVSSGFSLLLNADNTAITHLQASAATVATLKGPLNVTYTVTNTDDQSKSSTTADTIATDAITINDATMTPGTISTAYSYSFKTSAGLTVGSTGISSASVVTLSNTSAGLSAAIVDTNGDGVNDDVVISGTPISGQAGDLTVTLSLQTPDGQFTKTSTAALTINAPNPVVNMNSGTLDNASINEPYSYTYSNDPNSSAGTPYIYAGAGETFSSSSRVVSVIGSQSGDITSHFSLVPVNNNTQLMLTSGSYALSQSETLTITLDVYNQDAHSGSVSGGNVAVGSVTGYLYCPSSSAISSRPTQNIYATLYDAPAGGNALTTVPFTWSSNSGSGKIQLLTASLSYYADHAQLVCDYGPAGTNGGPTYVIHADTLPKDAKGYGWTGSGCTAALGSPDTSCQVQYTYAG